MGKSGAWDSTFCITPEPGISKSTLVFYRRYLLAHQLCTNTWSLFGWNGSVPFPHTNSPLPSGSKKKEPSFTVETVAERNGTVPTEQALSNCHIVSLVFRSMWAIRVSHVS